LQTQEQNEDEKSEGFYSMQYSDDYERTLMEKTMVEIKLAIQP